MIHACKRSRLEYMAICASLLLAIGWMAVGQAAAEIPRKLERQISVLEAVISEVLVDSPNLLVSSGGPTYGIYLDEFGVIFGLQTSLVSSRSSSFSLGSHFLDGVRVESYGDRVIVFSDDEADELDEDLDDDELEESVDFEDEEAFKKWRAKRKEREMRRYDRGKQELREALLDYGETLDLREDQWVAIAAFLEDTRYFRRKKISRLVLKVKVSDLREQAAGKISYEELEKRLIEEEY